MNTFLLPTVVSDLLAGRGPAKDDLVLLLKRVLAAVVFGGTLVSAIISLTSPSQDGSSKDTPAPEPAPAACWCRFGGRSVLRAAIL